MKRLFPGTVWLMLTFAMSYSLTSCDEEEPFECEDCTCVGEGSSGIGGWHLAGDSTIVWWPDSSAGFGISVDNWKDSEKHDIIL